MVNAGAGSPVSAAEPDRGPPAAARRLRLAVLNVAAVVAVAVLVDVRGCRGRGCGSSLGGGSVGARDLDRDAVPWPRARPWQTRPWANEAAHVKADTVAHCAEMVVVAEIVDVATTTVVVTMVVVTAEVAVEALAVVVVAAVARSPWTCLWPWNG